MLKVNNKNTTNISIVCSSRYLIIEHAFSAKVSQPALAYSKSVTQTIEEGIHWYCP